MQSSLSTFVREQAALVLAAAPVFLDTETTGLGDQDVIAEIALVDADGTILFESCVQTGRHMDDEVIGIHGITNEMLASAPTWPQIADTIAALVRNRVVVAHCASFDESMLRQTAAAHGVAVPEPAAWFCTMKLMLNEAPDRERISLPRSMSMAGATDEGIEGRAHRAAYDAHCCRRLLIAAAGGAASDVALVA